jgi:hypothetical protein
LPGACRWQEPFLLDTGQGAFSRNVISASGS